MGNKKIFILWLFVAASMYHCSFDNNITINGFNQAAWQKDSLGCMRIRKGMVSILQSNMEMLSGHSSLELKELLGPPNVTHKIEGTTVHTYFLEPGHQCYEKNWKEKGHTECLQMLFFIENDKVKVMDVIYP